MFRFAEPFWLLLAAPLALLGAWAWWRQRTLRARRDKLADAHLLPGLGVTDRVLRASRRQLVAGALGLLCWTVALANPQWGTRTRLTAVRTTELIVALDVSQSMLAADLAPSRLGRAQLFLSDLLEALGGERVGLVLFAGEAYLQTPITNDYGAVLQFARSANPSRVGAAGTNFAAALRLTRQLLVRPAAPNAPPAAPARKLILLVSDGENHEPEAETAARQAAEAGVRVLTAGIGTADGAPVPDPRNGGTSMKRDVNGEPVISRFEPATLQRLAELGEGRYFNLNTGGAQMAREVAAYVASENIGGDSLERFEESASYFQLFVVLGLSAWIWAWWVGRTSASREGPLTDLRRLRVPKRFKDRVTKPTPTSPTLMTP